MRIYEITGQLRITDKMRSQASESGKAQIFANIDPETFLKLTTDPSWIDTIKNRKLSLLQYNKFAKDGETLVHPFIKVDLESEFRGKVIGHEGRHRAAALMAKGGKNMPIAICLRPGRDYKIDKPEEYRYINDEYILNANNLPARIYGQYDQSFSIKPKTDLQITNPDVFKDFRNDRKTSG